MLEDMTIMMVPPCLYCLTLLIPFFQYLIVLLLLLTSSSGYADRILKRGGTTKTRITMRSISGHQQRDDEAARWVRAEMIKRVARELNENLAYMCRYCRML